MDNGLDDDANRVPENVITGIDINERLKLKVNLTRAIISQAGFTAEQRYDGGSKDYRRWFQELTEQLEECGFKYLTRDVKHPQADVTSQAEWNAFYNETDIRFIYDVSKTTVSQSAATAALNSTSNGILFIRHFYKQWGQP